MRSLTNFFKNQVEYKEKGKGLIIPTAPSISPCAPCYYSYLAISC